MQRADIVPTPLNKRIFIASIDFDGCLGGTEFTNAYKQFQHLKDTNYDLYKLEYKKALQAVHDPLLEDIIIRAAGHDEIVLMIGSNRQTLELDQRNANSNGNGLCYDGIHFMAELIHDFTQIPTRKDFHTYGDAFLNEMGGYQAKILLGTASAKEMPEQMAARMSLIGNHKYSMIYLQVMIACLSQPNHEFSYAFYDDLPEILAEAQQKFNIDELENILPTNLKSLSMSQYEDSLLISNLETLIEDQKNNRNTNKPVSIDLINLFTRLAIPALKMGDELNHLFNELDHIGEIYTSKTKSVDTASSIAVLEKSKNVMIANLLLEQVYTDPHLQNAVKALAELIKEKCEVIPGREKENFPGLIRNAILNGNYQELFYLLTDSSLNVYATFSEKFNQEHKKFKLQYRKVLNSVKDNNANFCQIEKSISNLETLKNVYDNISRCNTLVTTKEMTTLQSAIEKINAGLNSNTTITWNDFSPAIDALQSILRLLKDKNLPQAFRIGSDYAQIADNEGYGELLHKFRMIMNKAMVLFKRQNNEKLNCVKEAVIHAVPTVPATSLSGRAEIEIIQACTHPQRWENRQPSLQELDECFHKTNKLLIHATEKANFITELEAKLDIMQESPANRLNRSDIIAIFNELKNPNGKYEFIHEQRHSGWDSLRFKFKSGRESGQGEANFWHTATYQKAIKLLKQAYVARLHDGLGNVSEADHNAIIDYVRGNTAFKPAQTATRRSI